MQLLLVKSEVKPDDQKTQEEIDVDLDFHIRMVDKAMSTRNDDHFESNLSLTNAAYNLTKCYDRVKKSMN